MNPSLTALVKLSEALDLRLKRIANGDPKLMTLLLEIENKLNASLSLQQQHTTSLEEQFRRLDALEMKLNAMPSAEQILQVKQDLNGLKASLKSTVDYLRSWLKKSAS